MVKTDNIYDFLLESIFDRHKKVSLQDLFSYDRILVLGSNRRDFFFVMDRLAEANVDAEIIVQPTVYDEIYRKKGNRCHLYLWEHDYTDALVDYIKDHITGFSAFVYFSNNLANIRDINIMQTAIELRKSEDCDVFCAISAESVYRIDNVEQYCRGILLYTEIEQYLSECLREEK